MSRSYGNQQQQVAEDCDRSDPPRYPGSFMAIELPLDVHILIIEWVFRSSQHLLSDNTTLRACALVCRAWTPTAQRLLFRRIRSTSSDDRHCDIRLLVSILSTRPHLVAHVRCIQVPWPSYPPDYGDICIRLLELCHHVEGIKFFDWENRTRALSAEANARLAAIPLRPAVLDLTSVDQSVVGTILKICPGARVLILSIDYEHPLPPTVVALEIFADSVHGCFSHPQPLPALRYLCLVSTWWPATHLLSTGILPQLQSLQVEGEFPPPEILEQLAQLRILVVNDLPIEPVTLPPSLRRLGYHTWGPKPGVRADLAVDPLRALPELRLVTVTRFVADHVRAALAQMCRDKCVDFASYATHYQFQQPQDVDWI
ncbi:hypothetical protein FA95DRAFT_1606632 [Auriscalpium vulgare]|uniref:Uncharacterized protein n=1 Tax=Auriscalpium vulgare TaxID=40419 RepID=A0ACB8RSC3_9AGAM|nr:hypothetical protein FA95DRAFT_1606632 [Auriscalpium vulgare]